MQIAGKTSFRKNDIKPQTSFRAIFFYESTFGKFSRKIALWKKLKSWGFKSRERGRLTCAFLLATSMQKTKVSDMFTKSFIRRLSYKGKRISVSSVSFFFFYSIYFLKGVKNDEKLDKVK